MTFNDDSEIRGGKVSKRGRNAAIGGGVGVGVVGIVVFLIAQFTGVDLSGVVPTTGEGTSGGGSSEGSSLEQCQTGADANNDIDCRMQGAASLLDDYWATQVDGYTQPELVIFTEQTNTGCGAATAAVGPFYCPPDQTVYIDTSFYDELQSRFGASGGPLAQLYVVAHEWGHHIQNITGQMENLDRQSTGPTSDGVKLELQADCYAGSWVAAASSQTDDNGNKVLEPVTDEQIDQALSAAAAVGDDHIQETLGSGSVNPETWTHGSSDQRTYWFQRGLKQGVGACDTFTASDAEVLGTR